jgi:hypothetical protein
VNAQEAADILGVNRRRHGDLLEMLRALTLYPWLNTAEDENALGAARRLPLERGRQVFDADHDEE